MNELATIKAPPVSALATLASKLGADPDKLLSTLKATVFKGASNDELLALVVVANTYGLNPLLKELYAFPAKGGGIVPIVSIDGWLRIINDHPQMDGVTVEFVDGPDGKPVSCTATIYRKDRQHPTIVTEYFSECYRPTDPWKMAHRMLRHKAIMQAGRVAFGFTGLQDEDEGRITGERVAKGREVAAAIPIDPFARNIIEDVPPREAESEEWYDSDAEGGAA